MRKNIRDDVDQHLYEWLEKELAKPPLLTQSMDQAWENIMRKYHQETHAHLRRRGQRVIKWASIPVAAALLLFAGSTFYAQDTAAFSWFNAMYERIQGIVTEVAGIKSEDRLEGNEGQYAIGGDVPSILSVELDEAREMVSFSLKTPAYVPEGYVLKGVQVLIQDIGDTEKVTMVYEHDEQYLRITQEKTDSRTGFSYSIDNEDTQVEELAVNGHPASFLTYKGGFANLMWNVQQINYSIEGYITKEEALAIAQSMK